MGNGKDSVHTEFSFTRNFIELSNNIHLNTLRIRLQIGFPQPT